MYLPPISLSHSVCPSLLICVGIAVDWYLLVGGDWFNGNSTGGIQQCGAHLVSIIRIT